MRLAANAEQQHCMTTWIWNSISLQLQCCMLTRSLPSTASKGCRKDSHNQGERIVKYLLKISDE